MTQRQGRDVDAALALAGTDRKQWAAQKAVSYQRVNRMVRGEERVTLSYATHFNGLIGKRLTPRLAQAA